MAYGKSYSSTKSYDWNIPDEKDELDAQILAEKDPDRKSLLEEKRKQRNKEQKAKMDEIVAKAQEMGLDPVDYYDKLKRGEITEPTPNEPQQGGGIFSTIADFIGKVSGVTAAEQARTEVVKSSDDAKARIADIYQKTQLLYANTQDPVEKSRLEERMKGFENNFAQVERIKQSSMQPNWTENLVKHPLGATTDFLFGTTKSIAGETVDVITGKPLPPEAQDRSLAQNIVRASMASLEILTLGFGKKVVQKGLAKAGGEQALKAGLERMAGKDGLAVAGEILGEKAAKEITEEFVKKSLAEKITELSVKSKTKQEFVKSVGQEVAKSSVKVLGNKNSIEAATIGAAFVAGAAVESGETDPMVIAKEALKGVVLGYGLERGLTGLVKAGSKVHAAEKEISSGAKAAKVTGEKRTLKESLSARKEAYTPESLKAYKEGKAKVQNTENSLKSVTEAMKDAGVSTTKNDAIVRLQEEKMAAKSGREVAVIPERSTAVSVQKTPVEAPKKIDYNESFKTLGVEDYNIEKARKNYVREMNSALVMAEKGDKMAVQKIAELQSAWKTLSPHYTPKLAEKIADKKLATKAEGVLAKVETVKDIRTLKAAKADLFHNEGKYLEKGITKEQIASHYLKLSKAIDKLREKQAVKTPVESMSREELTKESRRLTNKEKLNDSDLLKLKKVNIRLNTMQEAKVKGESLANKEESKPKQEVVRSSKKPSEVLGDSPESRTTKSSVNSPSILDIPSLKKEYNEVKTIADKRTVLRKILDIAKVKTKESVSKKEVLDIPEPTNEELAALEKEMELDTEYSMSLGGTMVRNKFDLALFKNASKTGQKPYSLSQLVYDVQEKFKEYANEVGSSLDFKVGLVEGDKNLAAGEYRSKFRVARTLVKNDFSTTVHEFAHFATSEKAGFKTESISRNSKAEIRQIFKDTTRESYAKAMEVLAKDPTFAIESMPNFIKDLADNNPKLYNQILDANNLFERLGNLNPQDSLRGFQTPLEKNIEDLFSNLKSGDLKKVSDSFAVGKIKGTLKYLAHFFGREHAIAGLGFKEEAVLRINKQLTGGTLNPYEAGFHDLGRLTKKIGKEKAEALHNSLLSNYKLKKDYKSFNQILVESSDELYESIRKEYGLEGKKNIEKMMEINGDWMLLKHTQERKTLVGMFEKEEPRTPAETKAAKTREIDQAAKLQKEIEDKHPWAKRKGEEFFKWWKDSTSSVVDLYGSVFTPEEKTVLKQTLYENYFPVARQENGLGLFKKARGGVGLIKPAMEGFTGKLDALMRDLSLRRGKEITIKELKRLKESGADIKFEDITKPASEEQKKNWAYLEDNLAKTDEEIYRPAKGDLVSRFGKMNDITHDGKFLDKGIMYVVEDGRRKVYEIDPMIASMFRKSDSTFWSAITARGSERALAVEKFVKESGKEGARTIANVMWAGMRPIMWTKNTARAGIVYFTNFIVNNLVRDNLTMLMRYKGADKFAIKASDSVGMKVAKTIGNRANILYKLGATTAIDTIERMSRGAVNFSKSSKELRHYVDMAYSMDRMRANTLANEGLVRGSLGGYDFRKLKGFKKEKFLHTIENITGVSESRSRKIAMRTKLNEWIKGGGKLDGMTPQMLEDLAQFGNEITINWNSKGKGSQYLKTSAFGRATMTATTQDIRFILENPVQVLTTASLTLLPMATAVYSINHRNDEVRKITDSLDRKTKQNYWVIVLGKNSDGKHLLFKLAKPKEAAQVVIQAFEDGLDNFQRINPEIGYGLSNAMFDSFVGGAGHIMSNGLGADYTSQLNPLVQGGIEQVYGKRLYWGNDVVSPFYSNQEKESQQNEFTSIFAKTVGENLGWSPMVVDNYIKNIGGTLGGQFASNTAEAKGGGVLGGLKGILPSETEAIKSATTIEQPTGYNAKEVKEFYSEFDSLHKKYTSRKDYKLADAVKIERYHSAYSNTKDNISDKYEQIRKIRNSKLYSVEEKKKKMVKINDEILDIVRKFNSSSSYRKDYLKTGNKLNKE